MKPAIEGAGKFHLRSPSSGAAAPVSAVRTAARAVALHLVDATLAAVAFVTPLVCWPGAGHPFSTPKFIVLAVALVPAAAVGAARRRFTLPALPRAFGASLLVLAAAFLASAWWGELVSPYAVALQLLAIGWFLAVVTLRPVPSVIAGALAASATIVAIVSLLQWARLDPFALLGYVGVASGRMRVYGTLGNPNFLAVFLIAVLPLTLALGVIYPARRSLSLAASAIQLVALVATGSRAAVVALLAEALFLAIALRGGRRVILAASLVAALAILASSAGRPAGETLAGRLYIWKVSARHVFERPLLGFGPGAFEPMYVRWETQAWKAGTFRESERRFADVQDHAHNDFLEMAADSGLPASLALAALVVSLLVFACRHAHRTVALASACGVIAISAAALVDFPLHRPTELFVFWVLTGIVFVDAAAVGASE